MTGAVGAQTPIVLMCTERGGCALLSRYYIAITSPDRRNTGRYLCPQHKQLLLRKFTGFTSAETPRYHRVWRPLVVRRSSVSVTIASVAPRPRLCTHHQRIQSQMFLS